MQDYECRTDSPNWHWDKSQDAPIVSEAEPTKVDFLEFIELMPADDYADFLTQNFDEEDIKNLLLMMAKNETAGIDAMSDLVYAKLTQVWRDAEPGYQDWAYE